LRDLMTELPYQLPGKVYRSPLPFSWLFDPDHQLMDIYHKVGVDAIVMLTPIYETQDLTGRDMQAYYGEQGYDVIYVPVDDFSIPDPGLFEKAVPKALAAARAGKTLVVHCHAGMGRTGMFTACMAKVVFGFSGADAVGWVRQSIPDAVENRFQYRFVKRFELET
jgi:hypothetical protein